MNVTLEILEGPSTGSRISLHPGQELIVGRTEYADFAIPDDLQLSGKHFRLSVAGSDCGLLDLGSTNGTFVNDEKVVQAVLNHDDLIRAGTTKFRVISDDLQTAANVPSRIEQPLPAAPAPSMPGAPATVESAKVSPPGIVAAASSVQTPARQASGETFEDIVAATASHGIEGALVEVLGGANRGRNVWLRRGQKINVGRTETSDFVVPNDALLSSIHFMLECQSEYFSITAKSTTNPTLVNGEEVDVKVLLDGDRIKAGGTEFSVNIMGGPSVVGKSAVNPVVPTGIAKQELPSELQYTIKDCNSGFKIYRPVDQQPEPYTFLQSLTEKLSVYTVIDPGMLESPLSSDLEFTYVFDWLPPEIVEGNSPVFMDELDEETFQAAWCCDAMICFLSTHDSDSMLSHLRSISRYHPGIGENSNHVILGCFLPSIITMLVANSYLESAEHLLSGIEAVFVENPETGAWQVLAREEFSLVLEASGMSNLVTEE